MTFIMMNSTFAEDAITQLLFIYVQIHHSHLNTLVNYEASYLYLSLLTNSVDPLNCLILYSRVPPRVQKNYFVGCYQIQSNSCCLQRNNKYLYSRILLERLNNPCSIFMRCPSFHSLKLLNNIVPRSLSIIF